MLEVLTPIGTILHVPETLAEDGGRSTLDRLGDALAHYDAEGYVVMRGLIPAGECARVHAAFDADVRRSRLPMLRQRNMRYERHLLDDSGFLSNAIFNLQDLGSVETGASRRAALDILTHAAAASVVTSLLRADRAKMIQSMFFEAPTGTWAHQDSYYQDSASGLGNCVAGWFALESIDAGAGRFYACPRSHRAIPPLRNEGSNNVATGHKTYQEAVLDTMRDAGLTVVAPYLQAGDAIFWSSLTVHGS